MYGLGEYDVWCFDCPDCFAALCGSVVSHPISSCCVYLSIFSVFVFVFIRMLPSLHALNYACIHLSSIYIYIYICIHICVYIHIYREREREMLLLVCCVYMHILYIYTYRNVYVH